MCTHTHVPKRTHTHTHTHTLTHNETRTHTHSDQACRVHHGSSKQGVVELSCAPLMACLRVSRKFREQTHNKHGRLSTRSPTDHQSASPPHVILMIWEHNTKRNCVVSHPLSSVLWSVARLLSGANSVPGLTPSYHPIPLRRFKTRAGAFWESNTVSRAWIANDRSSKGSGSSSILAMSVGLSGKWVIAFHGKCWLAWIMEKARGTGADRVTLASVDDIC